MIATKSRSSCPSALRSGALLLIFSTLLLPLSAHAQVAIEEITVTAQKREQRLQDLDLSVDVIRSDRLDMLRSSAQDVLFLAAQTPSLYAESSSGRTFPRFYIRGLGNTDFDLNASQPVSLVYDEVVLENAILKGFPIFDVDRIEVLRGPQGSVFGRNTPAGVIKFESTKPSQEAGGYLRGSYGRFDTVDVEGAFNTPINETLSVRTSVLYQGRDDFVKNTFSKGENGFEEFTEKAARIQALYTPTQNLTALFNLHGRKLDGGSRLFRANIIAPGTDDLIPGFRLFSTGQDATQLLEVDNVGGSVKLDIALGAGTLTTVTAYESVELVARGDVDGGYGADYAPPVGQGSIPFSAESADNITGHDQFTQEARFAFNPTPKMTTTLGAYFFYENLELENLSFDTLSDGALNGKAVQDQETTSVALFTSTEYALTDKWTLNGGVRATWENRDFVASRIIGPFGAPALGPLRRNLEDTILSGDASVSYAVNSDLRLYSRYARSFRAPSVQGRIVFGDVVTSADSETINSIESGFKSTLLDGRATLNATTYYYETDNQQLTAVGGAGNFNQLLNADRVTGSGFEVDAELRPNEALSFNFGYSLNDTEIKDRALEVAPCAIACTVLDSINPVTGNARIDGNPLPQSPKHIANFTIQYGLVLPNKGRLVLATDVSYRSEVNFFLYSSAEFQSSELTQVGLRSTYISPNQSYEASWFMRNATDERSINGGIDFNNFSGFVSDPRIWGIELRANL